MKVRLKRFRACQSKKQSKFQFHEGPIKTRRVPSFEGILIQFQFHEGPIKTRSCKGKQTFKCSFNSMKVRLKPITTKYTEIKLTEFQFHEGPIKTPKPKTSHNTPTKFQFHEGPIKTLPNELVVPQGMMFQFHEGPIKTLPWTSCSPSHRQFQFHEGPIKTFNPWRNFTPWISFNSMKVRLKHGVDFGEIRLFQVSIPWRSD